MDNYNPLDAKIVVMDSRTSHKSLLVSRDFMPVLAEGGCSCTGPTVVDRDEGTNWMVKYLLRDPDMVLQNSQEWLLRLYNNEQIF